VKDTELQKIVFEDKNCSKETRLKFKSSKLAEERETKRVV
jgi:hypothetical protein